MTKDAKSIEKIAKAPPHGYLPNQSLVIALRKGQSSLAEQISWADTAWAKLVRQRKSLRENYRGHANSV